MCCRAA
jgi:hypothetical protein